MLNRSLLPPTTFRSLSKVSVRATRLKTVKLAANHHQLRTYYGHISDSKMAPNLEPYFKQ